MASGMYQAGTVQVMNGGIDLDTDTIKILLVTTAYTFDPDHDYVNDVTGEVTVAGYARQTLASKTTTADNTNNRAVFDAADVSFGALTTGETIGGAVIYEDRGSDATNPVLCFIDLADTPTNGSAFTIVWSANGILYI